MHGKKRNLRRKSQSLFRIKCYSVGVIKLLSTGKYVTKHKFAKTSAEYTGSSSILCCMFTRVQIVKPQETAFLEVTAVKVPAVTYAQLYFQTEMGLTSYILLYAVYFIFSEDAETYLHYFTCRCNLK